MFKRERKANAHGCALPEYRQALGAHLLYPCKALAMNIRIVPAGGYCLKENWAPCFLGQFLDEREVFFDMAGGLSDFNKPFIAFAQDACQVEPHGSRGRRWTPLAENRPLVSGGAKSVHPPIPRANREEEKDAPLQNP